MTDEEAKNTLTELGWFKDDNEQNRRAVRSEDCSTCVGCECEPAIGETVKGCDSYISKVRSEDVQRAIEDITQNIKPIVGGKSLDLAILALEQMQEKEPCEWCKSEYTIIDDDFGQPLHPNMVKHCFKCGRALKGENNG